MNSWPSLCSRRLRPVDYKTAGVVAFFMLLGELIETHTPKARERRLNRSSSSRRRRRAASKDNQEEEVRGASQLTVGDVIRIRPGDNVAADGVIVSGQGSFNQANITGESLPVDKKSGRRSFRRHAESDRRARRSKVSRAGTDTTLRPRARTHSRRREDQAAHHEDRGSIHGLLHAARAGHWRAGLGVHAAT
jgi:cation transport ATPase